MDVNNMLQEYTYSLRQAIGMATLKKSMSQDTQSVSSLIDSMQTVNSKIMESSVTPHKGQSIDVKV